MKGYTHLTPEQETAILASYARTKQTKVTAAEVGVSYEQVRHLLKKEGIALSGSTGGACYRQDAVLRQMAAQGASLAAIGRAIGTKHQLVAKYIREYSIPYTPFRQAGPKSPRWKGGRVIDKDGYVLIHMPDHPNADRHGYMREHRLVMEAHLGRYLDPSEVVHHGPRGKQCNALENLTLYQSNGAHLAATLTGVPHRLTPEGLERIRAALRQRDIRRQSASRPASGSDAPQ